MGTAIAASVVGSCSSWRSSAVILVVVLVGVVALFRRFGDGAGLVKSLGAREVALSLDFILLVLVVALCFLEDGEELFSLCKTSRLVHRMGVQRDLGGVRTVLMILPELLTMVIVCSRAMTGE